MAPGRSACRAIPSGALEGDGLLAQTKGPCASDIYSGDPVAQHITPP